MSNGASRTPAKSEPVRSDVLKAIESLELTLAERDAFRIENTTLKHDLTDALARLDMASSSLRIAEISRDTYMEASERAHARLDTFGRMLSDFGKQVTDAMVEIRTAPFQPRTAPIEGLPTAPQELDDPADQQRLQNLARKLAPEPAQ